MAKEKKLSDVEELEQLNDRVDDRRETAEKEADKLARQAERDNQAVREQLQRRQIRMESGFRIAGTVIATLAVVAILAICATANLMHRDLAFLIQAVVAIAAAGRVGFLSAVIKFI